MRIRSRREAILAGIGLLAAPAVSRAEPTRLRIGHGLPASHPVHPSMQHFADLVRERTGGELEIEIFPDGQIGQEANLLAQVQAGKLDFLKVSASALERTASAYRVFSLPFVFRDRDHWQRVMTNSVGESILASAASIGLVGLTYYDAGARSFYGRKAINHPDDLKGLKIRIQPSPTMARLMRLFGAQGVEMAWDQVYTALRLNLVDGAENNIAALVVGRHAEVISHYSLNEHTMVPDVFLVSAQRWQSLTPAQRVIMQEAALASYQRMNELWGAFEAGARKAAEQLGVVFTTPDKAAFIERAAAFAADVGNDRPLEDLMRRVAAS
ncbi:TRAP transporter substrate-binding protein [Bradyrhizobium sp. LHD-71]|uniref:TRAP transporter substrate-binding protein n=1 Tax=Bradyrhizobium sp. LHD-71 TaxID=3072141 RepID=UPI00280F64EB|nr:TRAP transporter substrate-binding protein [Bradyrhizobium sp. LHD-71]MDQ8732244.1 TRAP transporter substrate-binding protein [Bradyrhizobium sp. LHD-71]